VQTKSNVIAALRPILAKYRIKQAAVFGSYSRGDFDAHSDVDIVIDLNYDYPLADALYGFWDEAEDVLGLSVDLLSYRSLLESTKPRFKQNILDELEWFYET
jgi:predicted nucleotidyltransferase